MTFVLDASVVVACVMPDETSQRATAVLGRLTKTHAIVPSLWSYEVASAIHNAARRGRMTEADAALALRSLVNLPLTHVEPEPTRLIEIAQMTGLTVYDSSYLALSMSRGLPLATFDDRLAAAAIKAGVQILA
ncbi:MAG: type II toxin-antitoxin system VapC family toxin [Actinobacteria bacterium]|nr:type II toxin-antitoxin system VapC family toxin [Actinomycetota bacterium]